MDQKKPETPKTPKTPTAEVVSPLPQSTPTRLVPGSSGLAIKLSSEEEKSICDTAKELPQHKPTLDALQTEGLFGKSKARSKSTTPNGEEKTPKTAGQSAGKSSKNKTPCGCLNTAITPNGLSCKTAKTLQSERKTPRSRLTPFKTAITPIGLSCETAKSIKSVEQRKKRSLSQVSTANSCSTGRSFQPPRTPRTSVEIPPHVLAETKANQNKIVLTAISSDKTFKVIVTLKMKAVGQYKDPQALTTTNIFVNGEERYRA